MVLALAETLTREKAIECLDRLVEMGYSCQLSASPPHEGYVVPGQDRAMPAYFIGISDLHFDKVDVKALAALADELEVDLTISTGASFQMRHVDPGRERLEAVHGKRRHPRKPKT
jgi:hypothetical protein